MQRARPNTLSILERAQGQLSGKRFGKATTKQSQNIANEDNEEDELKAYLSQLQQRTTQQFKDASGDESDGSYHPNNSALTKTGSQFLKSNRVAKDSLVKDSPNAFRKDGKGTSADRTHMNAVVDMASEESSDISDISDQVSSQKSLEAKPESHRFLKEKPKDQVMDTRQSPKKTAFNKPPLTTSTPATSVKSSAFERIMSNLGSDEDDVESLIKNIESTPRSPVVMKDKKPVHSEPPPPPALSVHSPERDTSREDIVDEVLSQEESEIISSIASDSSTGLPRINVLQAADLEPALEPTKVDDKKKETPSRIFTKTNKQKENNVTEIESDIQTQEIQSDIDTEIHTGTESVKEQTVASDEETEADAYSYSSIASEQSGKRSPVKSESVDSISSTFGETTASRRSQTVTESKSVSSSYTDDFDSETNQSNSKSVSSSGTLTPRPSATPTPRHPAKPKDSDKRSPTPSPTPRRSRMHRVYVKDTGVQTSNTQGHDHWLYGHTAHGRSVDVSSLLEQHRSSSIPPETLHNVAVSSVDSTSLLLHQTLKLQFQQTQQSIDKMLQVHQSLLESIEGDYTYTTLRDTQAYIQRHRESKE